MMLASLSREGLARSLVLPAVLGVVGCSGTTGHAPRYSGRSAAPVSVSAVRIAALLPPGYDALGKASVTCRAEEGVVAIDGDSLSDVACSDAFLAAALREKASTVGGNLLVGLDCRKDAVSHGSSQRAMLHQCSARVAVGVEPPKGEPSGIDDGASPSIDTLGLPFASPDDAFRVKVKFTPLDRSGMPRPPRDPETVAELEGVPPGRVVLGDVVTRCHDVCGRDAVRYGVRAAAARVGATAVSDIECVRTEAGWLCTGRASRPEIDEPTTASR
jgi:hypothetical protein